MRHERFLAPISESDPCGPDLDEIGDEEYLNYFLPAEDRLPSRFYDPNTRALFDRATLDLKSELKSIDSLLSRSRDIRLIGLETRFQAFAGSIAGVSDCIQAIAGLVERFWDELHPKPLDEEDTVRQNIVGALDDRAKIVLPLHYAPIIRDKRLGQVTYRQHAVATGAAEKREEETEVSANDIAQALGSDENGQQTAAVHVAAAQALKAMADMRALFQERAGYDSAPSFGDLQEFFEALRKLIETSRPELAPERTRDADEYDGAASGDASADMAAAAGGPAQLAPVASASSVLISSHREAMGAMGGAEAYFASYEPSAPALILVHQARMLVGRPLVEAIEMLLPEAAERAVIHFEPGLKFQIGMTHMRTLTQDLAGSLGASDEEASERTFETQTRPGAAALLSGVEEFYRRAEPSSPIPMLLAKARAYLNRDFTMILNDLIAKDTDAN